MDEFRSTKEFRKNNHDFKMFIWMYRTGDILDEDRKGGFNSAQLHALNIDCFKDGYFNPPKKWLKHIDYRNYTEEQKVLFAKLQDNNTHEKNMIIADYKKKYNLREKEKFY
jgi:hypothetical protein